jgi:hypothetical protein
MGGKESGSAAAWFTILYESVWYVPTCPNRVGKHGALNGNRMRASLFFLGVGDRSVSPRKECTWYIVMPLLVKNKIL